MIDQITGCKGLVRQMNPHQVPPGSLIQADNCVIDREGIAEDRRGYMIDGSIGSAPDQLFVYSSKVLAHNGTNVSYGPGTYSNYSGSYSPVSGRKMRSVEAFQNCYVTTSAGVKVFTDVAGTAARSAGSPRPLDITSTITLASSGCLPSGNQCAYRSVIKRTDANGNVILSYPSNRTIVTNPSYTYTGTIANGSTSMTSVSSTTGLQNGMAITGTGIPAGTTISSISGSTITMSQAAVLTSVSTSCSTTNNSNVLTSPVSLLGIAIGMVASGTGITAGSTVTAIDVTNNKVTLSANCTATGTGVTITFTLPSSADSFTFGLAANPTLKCYFPSEVTTADQILIYRTSTVFNTSTDPGDEMALVYQIGPGSSDISNGYVSFSDVLIDALRGASLYTSPSQGGIAQANDRPPLCKDLALYYNNFMIYANTSTKQRLVFSLVGTGGLNGKTITLAGTTYTFSSSASAENPGTGTVQVGPATGPTGIAAVDIEQTARSLVRVINQDSSNTTVVAYYQSGQSDPPGIIMIEERGIGAAAYTLQCLDTTIQAMFSPLPPVSPATAANCTSSNQVQKNGLSFAQYQQPEAVPATNYLLAGAANKEILRVVPLRTSLIIIKEEGVFRLTGNTPQNFTITPLDLTVFCKGPDSVASLANTVIMLSNQGIVQITEVGVTVISRDIEKDLKPLLGFTNISTLAVGASYESDRAYFLSIPTASTDSVQNQIYRFNIFTRAWTHWTFGFSAAIVEPASDILYFAIPAQANVYKERKGFADTDYADPETAITITAVDFTANTVGFTISGVSPAAGWAISQSGTAIPIKSLTGTSGSFTAVMASPMPAAWAAGAATVYPQVGFQLTFAPWSGAGQAGLFKQVAEFEVLADPTAGNNTATGLQATFQSNFDDSIDAVSINFVAGGWGGPSGLVPWGGGGDPYAYRTFVPRNKQICRTLSAGVIHTNALEKLSVTGCAFNFTPLGSMRVSR